MVIAALASFAALLVAWIAAPSEVPRPEEPVSIQSEALPEAA
jgi:hypothetical protein